MFPFAGKTVGGIPIFDWKNEPPRSTERYYGTIYTEEKTADESFLSFKKQFDALPAFKTEMTESGMVTTLKERICYIGARDCHEWDGHTKIMVTFYLWCKIEKITPQPVEEKAKQSTNQHPVPKEESYTDEPRSKRDALRLCRRTGNSIPMLRYNMYCQRKAKELLEKMKKEEKETSS